MWLENNKLEESAVLNKEVEPGQLFDFKCELHKLYAVFKKEHISSETTEQKEFLI